MMKEFLNLNIFEELKDKKLSSMFHRVCFNFFVKLHEWKYKDEKNDKYDNNPNINKYK